MTRRLISRDELERRLIERGISDGVRRRILRLNPSGYELGTRARGWHPTQSVSRSINLDVVTRRQYDRHWGDGSARSLPREELVHAGGKRWWIPRNALIDGRHLLGKSN